MTSVGARIKAYGQEARTQALHRVAWRRSALGIVIGFVFCAITLMALAPIRPVAFAPGEVRTAADTVSLKTFDGGAVAEIRVDPGAVVRAGQPILVFDRAEVSADITRLASRRAHLILSRDRFAALLAGHAFSPRMMWPLKPVHLETARRQAVTERAEFEHETARFSALIGERRAQVEAIEASLVSMRELLRAHDEQLAIAGELSKRNFGTRSKLLEAKAQAADSKTRLAEFEGRRSAAQGDIHKLRSEQLEAKARREAAWSEGLNAAGGELDEVEAQLSKAKEKYRRLVVVSPINGRVLDLGPSAPGDVVAPNGFIASIVPSNADGGPSLVAEIRIAPSDIGYVKPGGSVTVDVSAFDAETFGEITGKVVSVSPGTLIGEDGAPYFRGEISLDRTMSRASGALLRLTPGMTISAKIATGENTLLGYLLKPVLRSFDGALRER